MLDLLDNKWSKLKDAYGNLFGQRGVGSSTDLDKQSFMKILSYPDKEDKVLLEFTIAELKIALNMLIEAVQESDKTYFEEWMESSEKEIMLLHDDLWSSYKNAGDIQTIQITLPVHCLVIIQNATLVTLKIVSEWELETRMGYNFDEIAELLKMVKITLDEIEVEKYKAMKKRGEI